MGIEELREKIDSIDLLVETLYFLEYQQLLDQETAEE